MGRGVEEPEVLVLLVLNPSMNNSTSVISKFSSFRSKSKNLCSTDGWSHSWTLLNDLNDFQNLKMGINDKFKNLLLIKDQEKYVGAMNSDSLSSSLIGANKYEFLK